MTPASGFREHVRCIIRLQYERHNDDDPSHPAITGTHYLIPSFDSINESSSIC